MKVIVIGGVAGGPSFATRLRRLNENIEILMVERGAYISYASCALPYYLGDVITELEPLIERTPEILKQKNNIDVLVRHEVIAIDPQAKEVTIEDLTTHATVQAAYDVLVLATGTRATLPPIPGIDTVKNGCVLRNVTDAATIKTFINDQQPKTATVIGAGAAGLEIAENFRHRGMAVTVIDQLPTVAYPYDAEITKIVAAELAANDVQVHLNTTVTKIQAAGKELVLSDGTTLATDLLIFATGVQPNSELAAAAGVELAADQHIIVDDQMATSLPDIYAIGDVVETTSYITGLPTPSMLSSAANRQGHLLADIIHGNPLHYRGFIGTGVAKIFNLTVSFVGYTEHMLEAVGITNYKTIFITPFDHAGFYPGAKRLNLKLIFEEKTGKLLGGQAVGERGVDKRIGELSAAITGKLTVFDLPDLELPYSPPYSTTRDPLNTAGYVAINQLNKTAKTIKAAAIPQTDLDHAFFLDVREADKPADGSIKATKNIPFSVLRDHLAEIPTDRKVYITFRKGLNPYQAARILAGNGINAILIEE
ncbi:FAD-dependent oxidoreductase [Loigolactobacillus jiayinensis]|uniref:FAD-dependent oxidoreductase n=1 Tax=Loigolactobacillus jiayinensis TaxID=2486016 RepID=A0ABW1RID1_9LACO|nr:FAD-dependent oxidoreductase [Loigolactobacillus jiayinensis]